MLNDFVDRMPRTIEAWVGGSFPHLLLETRVDNWGFWGTNCLLMKLGVGSASAAFCSRAQDRITRELEAGDVRRDTFGLVHKRVFSYAEYDVLCGADMPFRGKSLRENGISFRGSPLGWLRSFPTPINSLVGRDLCSEFQLLSELGGMMNNTPNHPEGVVLLFVSATPCISCVAAIRQFQLRFPRLQLHFANGERTGI